MDLPFLPSILDNKDDTSSESELTEDEANSDGEAAGGEPEHKKSKESRERALVRKFRSFTYDNLQGDLRQLLIPPGYGPIPLTIHYSLILPWNPPIYDVFTCFSAHNMGEMSSKLRDHRLGRYERCDLSPFSKRARQNTLYSELHEVDNLEVELMDELALEPENLPDLAEDNSPSPDDSTRRDDIFADTLSLENLNYLRRLLSLDLEEVNGQCSGCEWPAGGETCEHLRLVLKYWQFLVQPYPALRLAVSWGQVKCYCSNCEPDGQTPFPGMCECLESPHGACWMTRMPNANYEPVLSRVSVDL